jgi:hypothetical protein
MEGEVQQKSFWDSKLNVGSVAFIAGVLVGMGFMLLILAAGYLP